MSAGAAGDECRSGSASVTLSWRRLDGARIAVVEVSEPRRLNVIGEAAIAQLLDAVAAIDREETDRPRAVVLRGKGSQAFVGGADLRELSRLEPESARRFIGALHRACRAVRELPLPVIAQIRGYCLGAGLELAASCDFRLASSDAVFGMPEVLVGIPSVIEAALLPGLIGWGRAREMMLTGRTYTAAEAMRCGLVEAVVEPEALDGLVDERLGELVRACPAALAQQKQLFRVWEEEPLQTAIEAGIEALAEAYRSTEPRERMTAFLNRRRRSDGAGDAEG